MSLATHSVTYFYVVDKDEVTTIVICDFFLATKISPFHQMEINQNSKEIYKK